MGLREATQTKTKSSCCPSAGFIRYSLQMKIALRDFGEPAKATFGQGKIFDSQSFLRPIDTSRTVRSQQRILHIDSNHNFALGDACERRVNFCKRRKFYPFLDFSPLDVEESPPERARQSETTVIGGAATNSNENLLCLALLRRP